MRLLYGVDGEIAEWVALSIPHVGEDGFGPCSAIGIATNDKLVGGMVYHDYQPKCGTIQLSMAAIHPCWARPHIIKGLLEYPFEGLGVFKVWTATPLDGERAIQTNRRVGFTREATLAHHFGHKRHAVIMRMLKPDFYRRYGNGKERAQGA